MKKERIERMYTARLQTSICARTEEAKNSTRSNTFRASANSQRRMVSSHALSEEKQLVKAWEQSHAQQVSGTHKQPWKKTITRNMPGERKRERERRSLQVMSEWSSLRDECHRNVVIPSGKLGIFIIKESWWKQITVGAFIYSFPSHVKTLLKLWNSSVWFLHQRLSPKLSYSNKHIWCD